MRKFLAGIRRPAFATLLAAGGIVAVSATTAEAQFFNFLFNDALRPGQVERMLEMRGLEPVGPIMRNDQVYIVDVMLPSGRQQRLVIDAYDGRILEQFRVAGPPRYYGEVPSPRPPADIGGDGGYRAPPASGGPAVVTYGDSMASRGDNYPSIITVPPGPGEDFDAKPKPKPLVKHKKIELTPTASQPPGGGAAPPPAAAKPAATQAASAPPAAAEAKPAPAPTPTPPPVAPANPPPKASGGSKVNDVPVEPLN